MEDWSTFFGTLVQVALGLFTVLFALYQFKQKSWAGDPRKQFTVFIGFGELWLSAIFGFVCLTPAHPWQVASIVVGASGLLTVIVHKIQNIVLVSRASFPDEFDARILKLDFVSIAVYASFLLTGMFAIALQSNTPLYVAAFAAVWLLISGSFEAAWHMRR